MGIISSSKRGNKHQQDDDCNCEENDSATQKTISTERKKYCDELYVIAGEVSKAETSYEGQSISYDRKRCLFVWTEDNYRRYRNTDISIGTELSQSNDLMKENVTNYIKWGSDLSTSLKNIFKAIKDVKAKTGELRDAANKLEGYRNDSCNGTQISILTGESSKNCDDKNRPPERVPDECEDAKEVLDQLICMPRALAFDADHLFKASSDIIGIQVFSNISTLEPLQKNLSDYSKAFGKHIQDVVKLRETDIKKIQEELVKVVQETTRTSAMLYSKRSDFEGLKRTTKFLCCPKCGCVVEEDDCSPRLEKCKESICEICEQVKNTFCSDDCGDETTAS